MPAWTLLDSAGTGRSFELSVGAPEGEDGEWVIRAFRWPDQVTADDVRLREERIAAVADLLDGTIPGLPTDPRVIDVDPDSLGGVDLPSTRLLACRRIAGITLDAWLTRFSPEGAVPEVFLRVARDVAHTLEALHARGWVARDLHPSHILLADDGTTWFIGIGNLVPRESRPERVRLGADDRYAAPEVQREVGGRFLVPRADIWSWGLLLAFLATAEHPVPTPESPLTELAVRRLEQLPEGVRLLIARCTQPLQKQRFGSLREVLPFLDSIDTLPTASTEGFGALALSTPWLGNRPGTRVGSLSPGPLVSRPATEAANAGTTIADNADVSAPLRPALAPALGVADAAPSPVARRASIAILAIGALLVALHLIRAWSNA